MTKPIAAGDTISVHYTGRLEDGEVFDSSAGRSPLIFTVGEGEVIGGFDRAVVGMVPGEKKTFTVPPEDGYGEHSPFEVIEISKAAMPSKIRPRVGMELEVADHQGRTMHAVVVEVNDETVKLDLNNPFAGKTLVFDIEIVETGLDPCGDGCEDGGCDCCD